MPVDAGGPEPIDRMSVAGASGSGKTSLVRALFPRRRVRRRLLFDPEDEYETSAEIRCGSRRELHDVLSDIDLANDEYETFSVRYVPVMPDTDDADALAQLEADEAGYLAQWGMRLGDCVVLVDEAHNAAGRDYLSGHVLTLAKRGRKRNAFLWTASQGPRDVSTLVRKELAAAEAWYLLLVDENDLKVLRGSRGPEFADRVAHLPLLHALRVLPHSREAEEWQIKFRGRTDPPIIHRIS